MRTIAWIILTASLLVVTFGTSVCVVFLSSVFVFIIGGISYLYIEQEECIESHIRKILNSNCDVFYSKKMMDLMSEERKQYKIDNRLTGSNIIDSQLHDIIHFIFRDYIYPWYRSVSNDDEFPTQLRVTINKIIVNFANRVKEVDWTPYLTTQLVDDAASHLRLFKQARSKTKKYPGSNLMCNFFDLELVMEHNLLCRDHICVDMKEEIYYVGYVAEAILYELTDPSDFNCKTFRLLVKDILVNIVILPIITMFSDADYINRSIIWLCRDFVIPNEVFLTILKTTNNLQELKATRSVVNNEIGSLRSKDSGGDNDGWIKSKLSSLLYVDKIIDIRLNGLEGVIDSESINMPGEDFTSLSPNLMVQLPLDFILTDNTALTYFIDYLTTIGYQNYVFAYINIKGWKASALELDDVSIHSQNKTEMDKTKKQLVRAAVLLCEQYLSEKNGLKINMEKIQIRSIYAKICKEQLDHTWFDDVLKSIFTVLKTDEKFLISFRRHPLYRKLLEDLDLIKSWGSKTDEEDVIPADELVYQSIDKDGQPNGMDKLIQNSESLFTLNAKIIETAVVQENGKTFGVYAVAVTKLYNSGHSESWHVYRRYSDFFELHNKLKEKFVDLTHVPFPGKKTFNNVERNVLEKRMRMLNNYMQILLQIGVIRTHFGLLEILLSFLEPGDYDKGVLFGSFPKTLDTLLINRLKVMGNAVKTMPDNLLNTMDEVMEGIGRVFQKPLKPNEEEEAMKVGSVLDTETDDNVPLRIMLLLMTEVFDLKTSNQWLRRRIVALVRQVINAMFGDIVNKRILDYVAVLTSPQRVAQVLSNIKNSIWPDGMKADATQPRDEDLQMQTRVAAKCALLSSLSDELKHILGSDTSRTGLMLVFTMFQNEVLNKRLVYVFLEGILVTLFPKMHDLFNKLHLKSPRVDILRQKLKTRR